MATVGASTRPALSEPGTRRGSPIGGAHGGSAGRERFRVCGAGGEVRGERSGPGGTGRHRSGFLVASDSRRDEGGVGAGASVGNSVGPCLGIEGFVYATA